MFSVEQLLANDTWDRLAYMSSEVTGENSKAAYAFPQARDAYICRRGEQVSSSVAVALQEFTWWPVEMRGAYNTLISVISGALAEQLLYPKRSVLIIPPHVACCFEDRGDDAVLPLSLFESGKLSTTHAYTFLGHAALCMWLTGDVSLPGETCPVGFRALRSSIAALTSVWSLASAQKAATHDSSEEE